MYYEDYHLIIDKIDADIASGNLKDLRRLHDYLHFKLKDIHTKRIFKDDTLETKKNILARRIDIDLPNLIGPLATATIKNTLLQCGIVSPENGHFCALGHVIQLSLSQVKNTRNIGVAKVRLLKAYLSRNDLSLGTNISNLENELFLELVKSNEVEKRGLYR